jgi:ubiquinone/menaquinone biosynthesis C-methylase UbiE
MTDPGLREAYDENRRSRRKRIAWDATNPGNASARDELRARLLGRLTGSIRNEEMLDIGCGTGWLLRELVAAGINPSLLHGVDLLPSRVSSAQAAVPEADVRIGDARRLPYADQRFGAVFLILVLSSLASHTDVSVGLGEARRVTRPGGLIFCYENRIPNPFNPDTLYVRRKQLTTALPSPSFESLTVLPPLARRLRLSSRSYRLLGAARIVRTHRLVTSKRDSAA